MAMALAKVMNVFMPQVRAEEYRRILLQISAAYMACEKETAMYFFHQFVNSNEHKPPNKSRWENVFKEQWPAVNYEWYACAVTMNLMVPEVLAGQGIVNKQKAGKLMLNCLGYMSEHEHGLQVANCMMLLQTHVP